MSGPPRLFAHLGGLCSLALLVIVVVLLLGGEDLGIPPAGLAVVLGSALLGSAIWVRLVFDEIDKREDR